MTASNRITVDPDETVATYWRRRLEQHVHDSYRGLQLAKFPEDLRAYQHIIERSRPEIIVEIGTGAGGSALWFADQLTSILGDGLVVTIDVTHPKAISDDRITFIHGDAVERFGVVKELIDETHGYILKTTGVDRAVRVMVVDDASHMYEQTLSTLRSYNTLIPSGSFYIVEDTIVDTPLSIWPNTQGAGGAVKTFLAETTRFVAEPYDIYGLTMHMGGWLRAI